VVESQLPLKGGGPGKGREEGREGMDLKTWIWWSQLQKLDPPMDSLALFYFMPHGHPKHKTCYKSIAAPFVFSGGQLNCTIFYS